MRRTLASLTVAAAAAIALTGCVIAPPILDPYGFGFAGGYGPYDPAAEDFDPAAEEQWQAENRAMELDFAEEVAQELHEVGSALPPAEGESLEEFRHLAIGVGYEWCDLLYVDEERIGDADEHAAQAQRYGWTTEEYRVVVEEAEGWLCGY
ncbi:hypothetical protein [Agrococcus jenensis]|uniref:Uncharacterized protein n=1 Tax=Agrococcus jenensis TaxID=46353 RepID=A0A3N2AQ76_9MICO|nr:hypothetical protein [Agrococcus jenensis]ROR65180.1 hypothetical protein EDD26_0542 [Agrococcus jenensis]